MIDAPVYYYYTSFLVLPRIHPRIYPTSLLPQGFLGPTGMSWDVSLRDVNAGMPRTVQDMYGFKEQALYLIKVSGRDMRWIR